MKLAKLIFHSPILQDDLAACCAKAKIMLRLIKHSISTCWNSVAEMINSATYLHLALDKLTDMDCHNTVTKTTLHCLKLTKEEWGLLTELQPILSVCH
jgi:hypothetical protein